MAIIIDATGTRPGEYVDFRSLSASSANFGSLGEDLYTYGTSPTTYRYTGQRQEASLGLYFYGARWYDAYLNRWIQPDSIIPDPNNPLDWDRYSYVRNNPLAYTDPDGHNPIVIAIALIGIAIYVSQIPSDQYQTNQDNWGSLAVQLVGLSLVGPVGDIVATSVDCLTQGCDPVTASMSMLPGPNPGVLDNVADDVVDSLPSQGTLDNIFIPQPKANQVGKRGWSLDLINEVITNPALTRSTADNPSVYNRANGNPVTYYYRFDGHYVVIDNATGEVVQVSNTFDSYWIDEMTNEVIQSIDPE